MPLARGDRNSVRLVAQEIAKLNCMNERRRRIENPAMRDHAQKSAEKRSATPKSLRTGDHLLQPVTEALMVSGVFAVRVDQDVYVDEDRGRSPSVPEERRCCRGPHQVAGPSPERFERSFSYSSKHTSHASICQRSWVPVRRLEACATRGAGTRYTSPRPVAARRVNCRQVARVCGESPRWLGGTSRLYTALVQPGTLTFLHQATG